MNDKKLAGRAAAKMVAVAIVFCAAVATAANNYVLEWRDEFNGACLDTNRWNRCEQGNSEDLVEVKNGALVMWGVANKDLKSDPRPYLTGGVQSKGKGLMGIGKVEMRVKFEDHQKGAWPALWMCGEQPDAQGRWWPWNGEIDIVERLNGDPFVYQTVHSGWTYVKKHTKDPPHGSVKAAIRQGDWNVYGLEITENELIWSVNGKETFRYPKTDCGDPDQWPFDKPFYFLLDMQLGGKWVGNVDVSTLPVRMYIDWIRVYRRRK